jgi:hypothetical protein
MTDFKAELKKARAANDWETANELWKALCNEAEIELSSEDGSGGEAGKAAAAKMNAQRGEHFAYGKKI